MTIKIFTLGVLYFVQGLPYGFQDKFIPMYLRKAGLSHTNLSLMKLLLLPWLCKAAFAPLIDLLWTKTTWLISSLVLLALVSSAGGLISTENFFLVSVWLLLLNLFSAFQDVSVDAIAMSILKEGEIGHGNTAQAIGYKLGALFGGGVLFWVHYYQGWSYFCMCLSSLYIMSLVAFMALSAKDIVGKKKQGNVLSHFKEETHEKAAKEEPDNPFSIEESHENLVHRRHTSKTPEPTDAEIDTPKPSKQVIYDIPKLVMTTEGTVPVLIFLFFYKLGERGALSTFPLFLVDQGVSTKSIGFWSGVCGQSASLLGSVFGGWLVSKKRNLQAFLFYALLMRCGPIFMQWLVVNIWPFCTSPTSHSAVFGLSVASLCALEFTAGLVTTSVFTLMMTCSLRAPPTVQATHYSILSSVEVAGKLLFSSFSGALIDWLGLSLVYFLFLALAAASVLMVRLIR